MVRILIAALMASVLILGVAGTAVSASTAAPEAGHSGHVHEGEDAHPLGVLHPMLVHFPVAFATLAAFAVTLGFAFPGAFFRHATTFSVVVAALSSIPAFIIGLQAGAGMGRMSASRQATMDLHQTAGTISLIVLLVGAAAHIYMISGERHRSIRWIAAILVMAGAGVVGATGYLGGELVRGPGHLSSILPW